MFKIYTLTDGLVSDTTTTADEMAAYGVWQADVTALENGDHTVEQTVVLVEMAGDDDDTLLIQEHTVTQW